MSKSTDAATTLQDEVSAEAQREQMIRSLTNLGAIRSSRVEEAMRAVPRHLFIPGDSVEQAYEPERAFVTKKEQGVSLSSVSAARVQAFMLEQAEVQPGMRVLEVGSGGVNAAYLAELVGMTGEVTTIDIDPDVIERAQKLLPAAGYGRVHTLVTDGAGGEPGHAPYHRVVVTVGAADLPAALVDQLDQEDGRIVMPLRLRGLTRSVAFTREGGHLVAGEPEVCGFVPMRGADALQQTLLVLHEGDGEEVGLRVDAPGVEVDGEAVRAAFPGPVAESWSGVNLATGTSFDGLDLWLATACDGYVRMSATRKAKENGIVRTWSPAGVSAVVHNGKSLAYLVMRPVTPEKNTYEFGAVGQGPDAQEAADLLTAEMRTWDRDHRDDSPVIRAYRAGTPDAELAPGRVVDRRNFRFTISWPVGS